MTAAGYTHAVRPLGTPLARLLRARLLGRLFRAALLAPAVALAGPLVLRRIAAPERAPRAYARAALALNYDPARSAGDAEDVAAIERDLRLLAPEYPRITQPLIAVHGSEDRVLWPQQSERLVDAVPGAELRLIAGAGHSAAGDARRRRSPRRSTTSRRERCADAPPAKPGTARSTQCEPGRRGPRRGARRGCHRKRERQLARPLKPSSQPAHDRAFRRFSARILDTQTQRDRRGNGSGPRRDDVTSGRVAAWAKTSRCDGCGRGRTRRGAGGGTRAEPRLPVGSAAHRLSGAARHSRGRVGLRRAGCRDGRGTGRSRSGPRGAQAAGSGQTALISVSRNGPQTTESGTRQGAQRLIPLNPRVTFALSVTPLEQTPGRAARRRCGPADASGAAVCASGAAAQRERRRGANVGAAERAARERPAAGRAGTPPGRAGARRGTQARCARPSPRVH